MTENKRFSVMSSCLGRYTVFDDKKGEPLDSRKVIELLNENEWLKKENEELQSKASSWKITASNEIIEKGELLKENEQLKQQLEYIQNLISEHIKHQKTELGQKILQKIIKDYNEWLLGHKELKE